MKKVKRGMRKPWYILVFSLLLAINCSFADQQQEYPRPKRGSVVFGASTPPSIENRDQMSSLNKVFVDIAREVVPFVVSVIPTKIDTVLFHRNPFGSHRPNLDDDDDDFFFGPHGNQNRHPPPPPESRERRQEGLGSGVIVSKDGYVLTNYHVITGATEVEIRMSNNRTLKADVIGFDSLTDIAVLKISAEIPPDLPVAFLSNSDLVESGDLVVAVGNPFSLTSSVTMGIVSALGRNVGDASLYQNFIQTDAAINPGNSGGALVNIYGELVGINTLIYSKTGGFIGIGFAIPVNMAKKVMEDIIYEGRVIRGWIGIAIQDLTTVSRQALGVGHDGGVLVSDVFRGEPAHRAGIQRGDVIMSINKKNMDNSNQLRNTIAHTTPGKIIVIQLIRDGQQKVIRMTVSQRSDDTQSPASVAGQDSPLKQQSKRIRKNRTGIVVSDISDEMRSRYDLPDNVNGAVVVRVEENVVDRRAELVAGDVVTEARVSGAAPITINSKKDFQTLADNLKIDNSVLLLVRRENRTFFIPFNVD